MSHFTVAVFSDGTKSKNYLLHTKKTIWVIALRNT